MNFVRATVAALLLAPALALAQGPVSTASNTSGGRDLSWNVSVGSGSSYSAYVLPRSTGGASPGLYSWIGASASGTLDGGAADGVLNRFLYHYTTTFNGAGVSGITYQCAVDDIFTSVVLNGSTVAGAGCDQYNLSTTFTVSGFNAGSNTLTFNTGGNGVTDGLMVRVTSYTQSSTVPEPSSIALLGSGLLGLVPVSRRLKKS